MLANNTHIGWKKIAEHLTFFMSRMQASGYDRQFRLEILKSAINAHDKITREECEGKKIYRRREWRRNERRQEREKRKKNWFCKGGYKSVMFITATPNSELRRKLQAGISKTDIKIKVIEKSGKKVVRHLQRNNPFKEDICAVQRKMFSLFGTES